MSDETDQVPGRDLAAPKRKLFRNPRSAVRLSPEGVERQSRVTLLAWNLLGGDSAIAFLNGFDRALDGRPLDLAVASADGFDAVERALLARAGRA